MGIKILIGADIVPTESNIKIFEQGNIEDLIGKELSHIFKIADYKILNLETPITDIISPILKAGPNLAAPIKTFRGLKAINSDFYGLANNHILDQGEQGLISTVRLLQKNGIAYSGVGNIRKEAEKPFVAEIKNIRIGIYCCAEHEYSLATEKRMGANPYDPLYSFDHVKRLKEKCDVLIVLYHGGKEYYRYPSPMLQRVFYKFAESGADCIIAQHTHCIGCREEYKGSMLVYGQGNFIFDDGENEYENNSLLIEINTDGKKHQYSFIPIQKSKNVVRMAKGEEGEKILQDFERRSKEIKNSSIVEKKYSEFAEKMSRNYFIGLAGKFAKFLPMRILIKLSGYRILKWAYAGKNILKVENYIDCEAHRELVLRIAKIERERYLNKKNN